MEANQEYELGNSMIQGGGSLSTSTYRGKNENTTTCIFGDKKSGRTTLLNFLLSEADKYFPTTLYITDDFDSSLYIKARGGEWIRYWTDFSRQIFTNFASLFIRRF